MRVYTCIFEKNGKIEAKDITGPFDRSDAIAAANDKLDLKDSSDKLYAIVPGQHSDRLWIVEDEKPKVRKNPEKKTGATGPWPTNLPPGF